jgi:phosphoglycolate phosphatase-like HAD superfamily hydrolase
MKLVMFDIDGTLTRSSDLDDMAYIEALHDVFDFKGISADWESYAHVTDFCVLEEIYHARQGRYPTSKEVDCFRSRFLELLSEAASASGGVRPIRGASDVLARLLASPNYAVAYAGGAWTASAICKLRSAGLPTEDIPYAFADDDRSREGICKLALVRAETHYRCLFEEVIYVGDGVWDIRCAQTLGYSFIGIGRGEGYKKLVAEWAAHVLPDYQDMGLFFSLLELKKPA